MLRSALIYQAVETPSELFKLVDAVVICTPNKFHADLSIEAFSRTMVFMSMRKANGNDDGRV